MYVCMYVYDELLGRGRVPESSAIDLEAFNRFFFVAEKVASVRLKYQRRAAGVVQPCATWRVLAVFRQHSIIVYPVENLVKVLVADLRAQKSTKISMRWLVWGSA